MQNAIDSLDSVVDVVVAVPIVDVTYIVDVVVDDEELVSDVVLLIDVVASIEAGEGAVVTDVTVTKAVCCRLPDVRE
jgi:hypothetical protein